MQAETRCFANIRWQMEDGKLFFRSRLDVDRNQFPVRLIRRDVPGDANHLIPALGETVRHEPAGRERMAQLAIGRDYRQAVGTPVQNPVSCPGPVRLLSL